MFYACTTANSDFICVIGIITSCGPNFCQPRVCMGRSGTSADAVYARFSHFCYVGGFGDLGDPVVPTPRGVSGEVVTGPAY